jgi:hypothetical protein
MTGSGREIGGSVGSAIRRIADTTPILGSVIVQINEGMRD